MQGFKLLVTSVSGFPHLYLKVNIYLQLLIKLKYEAITPQA